MFHAVIIDESTIQLFSNVLETNSLQQFFLHFTRDYLYTYVEKSCNVFILRVKQNAFIIKTFFSSVFFLLWINYFYGLSSVLNSFTLIFQNLFMLLIASSLPSFRGCFIIFLFAFPFFLYFLSFLIKINRYRGTINLVFHDCSHPSPLFDFVHLNLHN